MIRLSKCKLTKAQIQDARRFGIGIELEHTTSRKKAYHIALQHECEFGPRALYYQHGLLPMERRLKARKKDNYLK